jgi:CO/xanthine dehydrogenase Mo-binding subunit
VVVEGDYFFEGTTHTPIEPHCAIGLWEEGGAPAGRLTVWSSTQVPHYLHRELARVLELDAAKVRVIQPPVGGGFGGKSEPFDLEFCVAKLAMKTGRPVKILYTREEVFYAHRGRHPFHMRYRVGATADGKLTGVDAKTLLDGGAYSSFGLVTTYYSGQLLTAPYEIPAYRFDSTRVFTNKPCCGPKRGHGSVQPRFAFEVQLDKLAERLAIDPIELRRRNFMGSYRRTSTSCASPPTASSSAWSGGARQRLEAQVPAAGARARGGGGGVVLHLRHQLSHLPQPNAAVRGADPGGPLRPGDGVQRRVGHRPGVGFGAGLHRLRGAGGAAGARAGAGGGHGPDARWTWARTRRASPS